MSERKHYLDWSKVLAKLMLVLLAAGRVFDFPPFYIKDGRHIWAEILIRFLDSWFMPIFFVIGGVAALYSIEKRGAAKFGAERLLIPPGCALISTVPLLGFVAHRSNGPESDDFWSY